MADKIAIILEERQTALQPLMVLPSDSFTTSVTDVPKSDSPASEQDQPAVPSVSAVPAVPAVPELPAIESQAMQIPTRAETDRVGGSSQQEMKEKSEAEAEASGTQEPPTTIQTAAAPSISRRSSSSSKLTRVSSARSHIPKLAPLKTSRESSPTKASTAASAAPAPATAPAAAGAQSSGKTSSRAVVVTSRSRTTSEIPKSSRKISESPVKIVRQSSASAISSGSGIGIGIGIGSSSSSSVAKSTSQTKATPTTPKVNPRSFKTTENPSKRSTTTVRNPNESKKSAVADSEVVPKGRPSLSKTMRGYSLDDPSAPPSSEFCQPIAPQEKVYPNTSQFRSQIEESETETEDRTKSSATKRSGELKSLDIKIKRSDSLTKDEKTECNTKAREREQRGVHNGRPKRFFLRGDSGLKRRHTVGGTRDFDKVRIRWLTNKKHGCEEESIPAPRWSAWDRLQPLISDEDLNVDRSLKTWMRSERMRTSSPELCRRSETCATFPPLFTLGLESELVAGTPMND